jgi:mRNA interferase HigB
MRIISKRRLREFWEQHAEAEQPLLHWYRTARKAQWKTLVDVRSDFRHADPVGACMVFNIGGNKYRIIAAIKYHRRTVYVLRVLTHKQYDTEDWIHGCHC